MPLRSQTFFVCWHRCLATRAFLISPKGTPARQSTKVFAMPSAFKSQIIFVTVLYILVDALLAVDEVYLDLGIEVAEVFGQVLGAVNAAVLAAGASEAEHQAGEPTAYVGLGVVLGEGIDMAEELEYLAVALEKVDDLAVKAGELLVGLVAAGVVGGAAVEDVAAAIAGGVGGYSLLIAEAVDGDGEGVSLLYLPLRGEDSGARVPSLEGRVRERLSVYYLIEHLLQIGIAVCCAGGEQLP